MHGDEAAFRTSWFANQQDPKPATINSLVVFPANSAKCDDVPVHQKLTSISKEFHYVIPDKEYKIARFMLKIDQANKDSWRELPINIETIKYKRGYSGDPQRTNFLTCFNQFGPVGAKVDCSGQGSHFCSNYDLAVGYCLIHNGWGQTVVNGGAPRTITERWRYNSLGGNNVQRVINEQEVGAPLDCS